MSDDPTGRAAAAATLRDYLADRDVPCDQCGYNLRGAQDVFCPECGAVIPRPPSEQITRAEMDQACLKLWCPECDYVVTGVNARQCPECGGGNLVRFLNQRPPPQRRRLLRPRGVPVPLWINTLFGLVELPLAAGKLAVAPSAKGVAVAPALVAGAMAIVPALIAALWYWQRPAIRRWGAGERLAAAGFAFLFGLIAWLAALAALR